MFLMQEKPRTLVRAPNVINLSLKVCKAQFSFITRRTEIKYLVKLGYLILNRSVIVLICGE